MTVDQMAHIVHPSWAVKRVMVMLEAYFDETGAHKPAHVFAVCGYVAPKDTWEKFATKWQDILDHPAPHPIGSRHEKFITRPLDYIRASEMEGMGKRRFRLLGQKNRDRIRTSAVNCIVGSGVIGIGSAISLDAYEKLVTPHVRKVIGDPYFLCFQHVITEVAHQAQMFIGEHPKEDIAYIFDQNPLWELQAHELYQRMVAADTSGRYRLGSVAFSDKRKFKPLQAADLLAYETAKYITERPVRPAMNRFRTWKQNYARYFDENGLKSLIEELKKAGKL